MPLTISCWCFSILSANVYAYGLFGFKEMLFFYTFYNNNIITLILLYYISKTLII